MIFNQPSMCTLVITSMYRHILHHSDITNKNLGLEIITIFPDEYNFDFFIEAHFYTGCIAMKSQGIANNRILMS